MKDSHVHTSISHDGISSMEEYIKVAHTKGIDEITFTEHYDIYDGVKSELKAQTLDVDYYYNYFNKIKNLSDIKINFGIEVGLQPDLVNQIQDMLKSYPFDFVIGSTHITCKIDISIDKEFFDGYSRHDAYLRYFNETLENIKLYDDFDVYGHLDYVVRYGGYNEKYIDHNEFSDILDEILKLLILKGKGIEINTSGIRYGLGMPHPNIDIIKRYKELGGKIITIGSDAHKIEDICSDFMIALDILEESGFDEIAIYHERKPQFIKIDSLRS